MNSQQAMISIRGLSKTYGDSFQALKEINLEINRGEIFALLGPNGAGKTTLINILCGLVNPGTGHVSIDGLDLIKDYRAVRSKIGLVPQELTADMFEKVCNSVALSRGLFGFPPDAAKIERILRDLSLWDKKDNRIRTLSGGMKRRLMIAKALAHEPKLLFLDEPTAGVDVALRRDMWELVGRLRSDGVTIILTTHYIEEAQEMADRVGVINKGQLILVEEKASLMRKLGKKHLHLNLLTPLQAVPKEIAQDGLSLSPDGLKLTYTFDTVSDQTGIAELIRRLGERGIDFKDLQTKESSLEEIFVSLVGREL